MTDKIKGGLADNMTLQDIADKHNVTLSVIESALADGIAVEMEHTDDKEQAEEIAKDHLFEMPDYYSKLDKMEGEKTNAIGYTRPVKIQTHSVKKGDEWAKTYVAAGFIEKGVCTYNEETILLEQETLLNAIHTMKGRPIVIKHQKVTPENMQEFAKGYTSAEGEFNPSTASFDVPFLVFDEEGKQKIADGWSVSCAYIPKAFGKGGTWHNTPYDREVTELEFTHLALVPDPRYEDAKIYENAKDNDMDKKGKWITIKGSHIFIEEGQDVQDAIDKQFNKSEIEFTGRNTDDLKNLLGDNLKVSSHDGLKVKTEKGDIRIFKEDKVSIKDNIIEITKPSYVGGKKTTAKLKSDKISKYEQDGENIEIVKDDNNKFNIHYGVDKNGKPSSIASGFGSLEEAEKTLKKHRPNYTEIHNSNNDNTKENYNMEKIEVEQGFLSRLLDMAQKPFLNAKEKKEEKDVKVDDDDEMEYEGKKYSKKELVNAYEAKCNAESEGVKGLKKFVKEEEEEEEHKEEEKKNSITDEDMEFFNSMQAKMNQSAQNQPSPVWSEKQGEKEGREQFRIR